MAGNADTRQAAIDLENATKSIVSQANNELKTAQQAKALQSKLTQLTKSIANWNKLTQDNNIEIAYNQSAIAEYERRKKADPGNATYFDSLISAAGKIITKDQTDNAKMVIYITKATQTLLDLQGAGAAAYRAAAIPIKPKSGSSGTGGNGGSGAGPQPATYKYNAPLVNSAYFNPLGPQHKMLGSEVIIDQGKYTDALTGAWKGQGGRGTIQMDRTINPTTVINNLKSAGAKVENIDTTLYGFKFLYNPTTVQMGWGVSSEVNPTYEALGQDAATPLAAGLIQSTISFELLLNRIEDFKYIDENGLKNVQTGTQTKNRFISETAGIVSESIPVLGKISNPYPYPVADSELKLIYNKGTMYDLEYLFRTLMGFNTKIMSSLNGETSDRGWLTNLSIELHLGSGLRYRVRVSSLDVQHIMFNERMTPILSKVIMTCTRYADFSSAAADAAALKKGQ
jgi:hypothetical protein